MKQKITLVIILIILILSACTPEKSSSPIQGVDYLHKDLSEETLKVVEEEDEESEKVANVKGVFKTIRDGIANIFKKSKSENDIVLEAVESGYFYLPIESSTFTSLYGARSLSVSKQAFHSGIDFGVKAGTPIGSISDGRVVTQQYSQDWGNYVEVETQAMGETFRVLYAHMRQASPLRVGDIVRVGDKIGEVGSTGDSTGPHLHLEVTIDDPNRTKLLKYVDSKHLQDLKNHAWWWDNPTKWARIDPSKFFIELAHLRATPQIVKRNNSPIITPKPIDTGLGFSMEGV